MIYLYTDFGTQDIYLGQLKAALHDASSGIPHIDMLHDAPVFDVVSNAHLLHALASRLPITRSIIVAIVDPGVGGRRRPIVLQADGRWYVGPDNGLLSIVAQRAQACKVWEIAWRPERMSETFHGRDLFAPMASKLAVDAVGRDMLQEVDGLECVLDAADRFHVIYVDHYGNVLTGIRRGTVLHDAHLRVAGRLLAHASYFAEVPEGEAFWYENSIGLIELAVNRGHAAERLGLRVGDAVELIG